MCWYMHRFDIFFIACWGMFWYNFKKILLNMCVQVHFIFSYSVSVSKCSHMTHLACTLPLFVCHVSSAGTGWPALFRCLRTNQAPAQFGGHGAHQLLPIIVIHVCSQKNISGSPQHTNIHIRRTLRIKSTRYLMSRQIGYLYRYMWIGVCVFNTFQEMPPDDVWLWRVKFPWSGWNGEKNFGV